jgi:hypothetical protein
MRWAQSLPTRTPQAGLLLSYPYCAAMALAVLEYAIESRLAPGLKLPAVTYLGALLCALGEALRKAAIVSRRPGAIQASALECSAGQRAGRCPAGRLRPSTRTRLVQVTAGRSFTHEVSLRKQDEHRLVTWGVYRWGRWALPCRGGAALLRPVPPARLPAGGCSRPNRLAARLEQVDAASGLLGMVPLGSVDAAGPGQPHLPGRIRSGGGCPAPAPATWPPPRVGAARPPTSAHGVPLPPPPRPPCRSGGSSGRGWRWKRAGS